ncbi:NADPH-dependent FMN reductase [Neptunicella marina]|uniref:NAD(P)H-dependent oxidoreductase n=1 Tax=Neptunicella marina TaxID=2125989 RepID=A0A8J6ITX5_9ALTE|nr:NADPH-dependent FMN reductase [Neptunicella marina]MBC3765558.1 NAD(P)H-dependent oxidoreductase [Neptunicella marina]
MKLLAISGSARLASTNTALLQGLKKRAPEGVELQVFQQLHLLPVFSPDLEGAETPASVEDFVALVAQADGIIICSPEYVRAIPGGLKNAIDWLVSRFEVIGKPVVLAHASHRGDDMLASLRLVLSTVSEQFQEQIFLKIPLVGKSPADIETLLHLPESESQISAFLNAFIEAVNHCNVLETQGL